MWASDPADRHVYTLRPRAGLTISIGPDSYDRNDVVKISMTTHEWDELKEPVLLELRTYEVTELVIGLMKALDEI